ncbi:MAG: choice-of-anchor D domain-containing protein [Candidatus Cloacimonetes bacterium]|nr:choice-of-anchor D domain-containing protein [Candidatus Cloacimonadota bacterium]
MKGVLITIILLFIACSVYAEWTIVATYTITGKASGLAYDGTYLYYGIYGADGGRVFRFDPSTGQEILLFNNPTINDSYGMTYDGQYLWITDHTSPSSTPAYAMQLDFQGNVISQFDLPDHYMSGIAYDDGDFWVMTYYPDPGVVYKVSNTGQILQQFVPPNDQPWDICLEGDDLWTVDYWAYTIHKVTQTGTILESQMSEIQRPAGIVYDGQYLWYLAGAVGAPSTLYKVDLGGTGTPVINVSFNTYDFGNVIIDETASTNLTISNNGTGDLVINDITFLSDVFETDAILPITLEQNENTSIEISFTPDNWGEFIDTMTIHSNDPITPAKQISLSGYGLFPEAHFVATPDNLDYGLVRVGADTGRFFTISNQGMTNLQISNIGFSDQSFFIDDTVQLPINLAVREEYNLRIWFNPSTTGQIVANATFSTNDPDNPQPSITIVGSGQTVDLSLGAVLWSYQIQGGASSNIRAIQAIPDIWGNGLDDVIVCGEDNYVRAYNGNSSGTADVIWEQFIYSGNVYSFRGLSISGDLNGDDYHDVVVGTTGGDRSVRAYSGKTGELLWQFNTNIYGNGGWVYQVDARFDFNSDGVPDVLASTGDDNNNQGPKRIFLINGATGSMIWERYAQGPAFSVIGVQDFTGNGIPDVIAGASNEAESQAFVHGINGATGAIEWTMQPAGTSVWALSQIDDVNGDGIPDVLIGSFMGGGNYYALDATDGSIIWSGSTGASLIMQFEVLGDVNGDGYNDIAIGHVSSHAAVFSGEDGQYIWSQNVADNAWYIANGGDLTGNGINDLFVGTLYQSNYAYFIDSTDGEILLSIATGTPVDAIGSIPDVTGDNSREMIVGGRNGSIRCFSGGPVTLPDPGYISGNVEIAEGPGVVTEVVISANGESVNPDENGDYIIAVQPGTYTVTASLLGYISPSVSGVVVHVGETTSGVDFIMMMLPLLPPVALEVDDYTGLFTWEEPQSPDQYFPESYNVYLDNVLIENTTDLEWTYEDLVYNTTYLAGVSAVYYTGESEIVTIEFTYTGVGVDEEPLPIVTKLHGNYPNPFNPDTTIHFSLETSSHVIIDIFNIKGERVKRLVNEDLERGNHHKIWDGKKESGKQLASGIYFYSFIAGEYRETGKMLMLK